MREIGGYIELDTYHLPMLHEGAIALNCGRNALAYLLRARHIKRLWIPKFICDSVTGVCEREGVPYTLYGIGLNFRPSEEIPLEDGEWLYFVNYYSQFDNNQIAEYVQKYGRVIVDNAQSYFQPPITGVDTLYTCRKYFGVADGAFLYTNAVLDEELPIDESFAHMLYLLGRFERPASEFYSEYAKNNELFAFEPIKRMSKLTRNLLHGIDYDRVKRIREKNYSYLHQVFKGKNKLKLHEQPGTFMYPLMLENGAEIRKQLIQKKIYIPMLWPNVTSGIEGEISKNILPLPIDQRYEESEMDKVVEEICRCI